MIGKPVLKGFAASVAIAGLVLASAMPAGAAIKGKAKPGKNLLNNTTITVSATGFPANDSLVVVECTSQVQSGLDQGDCDLTNIVGTTASSKGKVGPVSFTFHTGAIGTNGNTCNHGQTCLIAISEPVSSPTADTLIKVTVSKSATP